MDVAAYREAPVPEPSRPPTAPRSDEEKDIELAKLIFAVEAAARDSESKRAATIRTANKKGKRLLGAGASLNCYATAQTDVSSTVMKYSALLGLCRVPELLPLLTTRLSRAR